MHLSGVVELIGYRLLFRLLGVNLSISRSQRVYLRTRYYSFVVDLRYIGNAVNASTREAGNGRHNKIFHRLILLGIKGTWM